MAIIQVPTDFSTIQAAVNGAAAGDTIVVAAGTFTEAVNITKPLTLRGANFNVPGNGARTAETIVNGSFKIKSNNVTIEGFEFSNSSSSVTGGDSSDNFSNIIIRNNDFVLINAGTAQLVNGFGNGGAPSGGNNWLITGNRFSGLNANDATAIRIDNINGLTISNNEILHTNQSVSGRRGIQIDNSQNVTVTGNNVQLGVTDFSDPSAVFTAARYGLQLSLDADGSANSTSNVKITNNTFAGAFTGITTLDNRDLDGLNVSGNTFNGLILGVRLAAGSDNGLIGTQSNIEIENNNFNLPGTNPVAVFFDNTAPSELFQNVVVRNNNFNGSFRGTLPQNTTQLVFRGNNFLEGSSASETLLGGSGNDTLRGGAGNDTLIPLEGNDLIDGGAGDDLVRFSGPSGGYFISRDANTNQIIVIDIDPTNGDEGIDTLVGIENLRFSDGNIDPNNVTTSNQIIGTNGADFLGATNFPDLILGFGGNDRIDARAGNDFVFGGAGNDSIFGGTGDDTIIGGTGNDTLRGGDGNDVLTGGSNTPFEKDVLDGGLGNDIFILTDGTTDFYGSSGNSDFATIVNLGIGDKIAVTNTATINVSPIVGGVGIFSNSELIAVVQGSVTPLTVQASLINLSTL